MSPLLLLQISTALAAEPFVDERLFVRFHPPVGWQQVEEGVAFHSIVFRDSRDAIATIQIDSIPYEIEDPSELESVQRQLRDALLQQFESLQIVEERPVRHGDEQLTAIEVSAKLPTENTFFHVVQRCFFARGRVYIITAGTYESTLLGLLPTFRAAIQSVEVLDPFLDAGSAVPLIPPRNLMIVFAGVLVSIPVLRSISKAKLARAA